MHQRKVDSLANKTCVEFYNEEERGEGIKTYRGCLSHNPCAAETPKNSAVDVYSKTKTVTMMTGAMFGIVRF